ncbi:MAG: hypothetical protein E3J73_03765 [Candidatus Bathyarchaeum sp.]|nr:MAG: hypothetical protein E3J73_03765 [Candidatus Bathyarchaeum sp.]
MRVSINIEFVHLLKRRSFRNELAIKSIVEVEQKMKFPKLEESIACDKNLWFTVISYTTIFVIFANLTAIRLPLIGTMASLTYFLINGIFLGRVFFKKNQLFLRFTLGNLLLLVLLGLVGWAVMIAYNLDAIRVTIVLTIVTTLCSLVNRLEIKNSQQGYRVHAKTKATFPTRLHILRSSYLFMVVVSFYLLFISRSGEVHTVWEIIHPLFIPAFFITTFLLLGVILSSDKVNYKLFFIIIHSILSHIFMVIIFPAGNVGVQQEMLGRTRLVFDNTILHVFGWTLENIPLKIYVLFRGGNLQTAFSVTFARMFGVDVYWSHLLLIPLLWGVFVPIIAFMVSKTLGASEKISILSSLLISLFPTNILWGAVSISNSLGYLFFFCFTYSLLKYINSNRVKDLFPVAAFFFASFLSHYLAGTIALCFLILAYSVKMYEKQKASSPVSARFMLLLALVFCASIMPFALAYRSFFYPWANTSFSLQKLYERPFVETVLSFLLGSYFDLISREAYITTLIFGIPTFLGLIGLTYVLIASVKKSPKRSISPSMLFLSLALITVILGDRIVKLFMINVPFVEIERLWLFRDFLLISFTALIIGAGIQKVRALFIIMSKNTVAFLRKTSSTRMFSKVSSAFTRSRLVNSVSLGSVSAYLLVLTILSGWVTVSVYYAYPHWAPLQTTSYELEAAKYIKEITNETYIVICDSWFIYAGGMIVGIGNPQAYYFSSVNPKGVALFIEMKKNPSNETLVEAMEINNATTAYFIIEKPRIGTEKYDNIKSQATQNGLKTLPLPKRVSHYQDKEKLCIFYYKE